MRYSDDPVTYKREYMKAYRLKNKEKIAEQKRAYMKVYKRPSRRKSPDSKCFFCRVFLASRFGSKTGTRYCDDCRNSKRITRHLHNVYQKRAYYVRTGRPVRVKRLKIPALV